MIAAAVTTTGVAVYQSGCGDDDAGVTPTTIDAGPDRYTPPPSPPADAEGAKASRVVVIVLDGFRPDYIGASTPTLSGLRTAGVSFSDHHSAFPTQTVPNASALATGATAGLSGFGSNSVYKPGFNGGQPSTMRNFPSVDALDQVYGGKLFVVSTLFEAAQAKGLRTAAVGKAGAAYIQDRKRGGIILDENAIFPLSFAQSLQDAGVPIPKEAAAFYADAGLTFGCNSGDPDPVLARGPKRMVDKVTADPLDPGYALSTKPDGYFVSVFVNHILPKYDPHLSVLWLREPDSSGHSFGPGADVVKKAVAQADANVARVLDALTAQGKRATTDVIVMSDHGFFSVQGDTGTFPSREIIETATTPPAPPAPVDSGCPGPQDAGATDETTVGSVGDASAAGHSVSGHLRVADLLTKGGFKAFDGTACANSPTISGTLADGNKLYPQLTDGDGGVCGTAGTKYTTPRYRVPGTLATGTIVVDDAHGAFALYVPDHDATTVGTLVRYLQSRHEVGPIFLHSRYGSLPGTLGLSQIRLEATGDIAERSPDLVVGLSYFDEASIGGIKGTSYMTLSTQAFRGGHGGFSPQDIGATLIASGPSFKAGFVDTLPSGNVDVAPTVAKILGLNFTSEEGRALGEALIGAPSTLPTPITETVASTTATGLTVYFPTNPGPVDVDGTKTSYSMQLRVKKLTVDSKQYTYFDWAKATRQ
jgi:arylsulfatase A-like enzyme